MIPKINPSSRQSLKTHRTNWKDELRQNCLRRIKEERAHLLWKIRSNTHQSLDKKEIAGSTFREIVFDELQKIKQSPSHESHELSKSKNDDLLWEYDGLHSDNLIEIESEDILIETERLLYEELREEMIRRELEVYEEEDEYLARAVFENMQLGNNEVGFEPNLLLNSKCPHQYATVSDKVWCPICKQGELREAYHLIYCTGCDLRLDLENDKVNLDFLKERLGEVHVEHLERGCSATPRFCMNTIVNLTALYIQCPICDTFEIVI